jgi:hypothetical protein
MATVTTAVVDRTTRLDPPPDVMLRRTSENKFIAMLLYEDITVFLSSLQMSCLHRRKRKNPRTMSSRT